MSRLVLLMILGVTIIGALSVPSFAQESSVNIPEWVKGVANFWVEDKINDGEFAEALEFLIDAKIINLGENVVVDNTMSELQEENTLLKEKLEISEANRVAQSQSDAAQHKILYDEKDAEYEKLKGYFDGIEAEWKQTRHEMAVKIDELEGQIKQLK